jgi:hypothetical protein
MYLRVRRIAASIRSLSAPAAVQIGFQAVTVQTGKISRLDGIFPILPSRSPFRGDGGCMLRAAKPTDQKRSLAPRNPCK